MAKTLKVPRLTLSTPRVSTVITALDTALARLNY
jgi:hypothetical protein